MITIPHESNYSAVWGLIKHRMRRFDMRTFKIVAFFAALMVVLAAFATSAVAALPSILLLEGTAGSTKAESTTATNEDHGPVTIKSTGFRVEFLFSENMASLGKGLLWLLNTEIVGVGKCNSLGDTAGNVLVPLEWHLVLALGGGASLFLILLLITPTVDYDCGTVLIFLSGSWLWNAEKFGVDTTSFTATTGKCTGTSPAFKEYDNEKNEMSKAGLISEVSEIKGAECTEINNGAAFGLTASTMLEVMEP
jgi:hypothetical protein